MNQRTTRTPMQGLRSALHQMVDQLIDQAENHIRQNFRGAKQPRQDEPASAEPKPQASRSSTEQIAMPSEGKADPALNTFFASLADD